MFRPVPRVVQVVWAAAQIERSPPLAPRGTGGSERLPPSASALLRAVRVPVLVGSAFPALPVPTARSLPLLVQWGSARRTPCQRLHSVHPP